MSRDRDVVELIDAINKLRRDHEEHVVRTRNMLRVGPVIERDHEKGVRIDHGVEGEQDKDHSPWAQPSERSGVERDLPNLGEQLCMISPYGDGEQGITIPFGHSDAKKNPASHADETVLFTRGKVKISVDNKSGVVTVKNDKSSVTITGSKITNEVDGNKTDQTKEKTEFGEGKVRHGDRNIGKDHVHSGVQKGVAKTEDPDV